MFPLTFNELFILSNIFRHSVSNRKGINLNAVIAMFSYKLLIFFNLELYILATGFKQ
jgi:hypothetical protein